MVYIYLLLILLNTSSALAIYFNKKIEETIFLSIALKILILFLFGIFINLEVGFYILLFLNIPVLVYNVYSITRNTKHLKNNILTVGLMIFILTYLLFIWIDYGRMATIWDEFSHWALVVKNMFSLNNFGTGIDSNVLVKSYLSGTSLFQYFCTKLNGSFNESILYLGVNLTSLSLLIPMFKYFKTIKKISIYILWFTIISVPMLFYPEFYSSLYVDAILGICFAYSLYSYYFNYEEGLSKFNIINLSFALMMLIFIKDIGIILALITIVTIFIDNVFIRNKFKFNLRTLWDNSRYIVLAFVPCLIVKILWVYHLSINNVSSSLSAGKGILSNLLGLLSLDHDGYKYGVVYKFFNALFFNRLFGTDINISYVLVIGLFIFLAYKLTINIKNGMLQKSCSMLASLVVLGAIGYALLLLLSYLSVFSEYEALNLASFERYIGSYALGMCVLILALFIKKHGKEIKGILKVSMTSFVIMLVFVDFTPLINMTFFARDSIRTTINKRSVYIQFKETVDKYMDNDKRLYFISTNDKGLDFYIARYEIAPKKTNLNFAWSIGVPYYVGDVWTRLKAKEEWEKELKKDYDYVYLFDIDSQFIEEYGTLFNTSPENILDNQLYKVNKSSTIKLLELVTDENI